MYQTLHCVSLRVIKHSDSTSILTVWSQERGRLSIAIPAGAGRGAQRYRALTMPMSLFEGVERGNKPAEIVRLSDIRPFMAGAAASIDPVRNVVAMFMADFLYAVLRENEPDEAISQFLFQAVELLKQSDAHSLANLHLYLTYHLTSCLGIAPDIRTYHRGWCFDMREGIFTPTMPLHRLWLDPQSARMVYMLSQLTPDTLGRLRLNRTLRSRILDTILEYYTLHHTSLDNLPSLQIIRTLFE